MDFLNKLIIRHPRLSAIVPILCIVVLFTWVLGIAALLQSGGIGLIILIIILVVIVIKGGDDLDGGDDWWDFGGPRPV